jgi:hypothetical protein
LIIVSNVEKREDPKGTSQSSLKYSDEPTQHQHPTVIPTPRRGINRMPPPETTIRDSSLHRRGTGNNGDDMAPLIPNQRQYRPGDVSTSASVPEYHRPSERDYPVSTRKKSGPSESGGFDYYVGYAPEHEQTLPYVEYFTSCLLLLYQHANTYLRVLFFALLLCLSDA